MYMYGEHLHPSCNLGWVGGKPTPDHREGERGPPARQEERGAKEERERGREEGKSPRYCPVLGSAGDATSTITSTTNTVSTTTSLPWAPQAPCCSTGLRPTNAQVMASSMDSIHHFHGLALSSPLGKLAALPTST